MKLTLVRRALITLFVFAVIGGTALVSWRMGWADVAVLQPAGLIAGRQRDLMLFAALLSLVIIVPVFAMTFWIVWRYREGKAARYTPEWEGSKRLEAIWWGVPIVIIAILSVVTWTTTHELDPYRPIVSTTAPLRVQAVAMQWKWLFIYPELGVASVNMLHMPTGTPVHFDITADAPMNSLWIPKLGGQVYAMSGMTTQLNLQADTAGDYRGQSANLSGDGFAGMSFVARATSSQDFDAWVASAKGSARPLTLPAYQSLASPSKNNAVADYSALDVNLFDTIVDKYMGHGHMGHPEEVGTE